MTTRAEVGKLFFVARILHTCPTHLLCIWVLLFCFSSSYPLHIFLRATNTSYYSMISS